MSKYQGELVGPGHLVCLARSSAACGETDEPVHIDPADILYSDEDEVALELYSRKAGKYAYSW